jgi:hypothetical protein
MAHDCDPKGPAASWQDQYTVASEAATKIDSRAFLVSVAALPAAHNDDGWSPEKALAVRFNFSTPQRKDIHVRLLDTSPSTTVEVYYTSDSLFSPFSSDSHYTPETLSETMRSINISPRQTVSVTWPLASTQADLRHQNVHPSITFDPLMYQDSSNLAGVWHVSYWTSLAVTPLSSAYSSGFAVDKSTGDVLGVKYSLSDPLVPTPINK